MSIDKLIKRRYIMKILTKDWAKKYQMIRFLGSLKKIEQDKDVRELKNLCKRKMFKDLSQDQDVKTLIKNTELFDSLFNAKLGRNAKVISCFSSDLLNGLERSDFLSYGFTTKKDSIRLQDYQNYLLEELENASQKSRDITEKSCKYLSSPFDFEEIVGELIYDAYARGIDYFIEVGGRILRVKNYKILERDAFKVNVWQDNNPLTCWTCVEAVELYFNKSKGFEIHLLILNGDEYDNTESYYLTLTATDVLLI